MGVAVSETTQTVFMGPPPLIGRITRAEHRVARAVLILDFAKEPRTVNEMHVKLNMPIASTYRIVRAFVKLGWMRSAGSRVVVGARGTGPAKAYIATSRGLSLYPHPCGECAMTIYSPEHEALHACR